jgi:hypothetical protein
MSASKTSLIFEQVQGRLQFTFVAIKTVSFIKVGWIGDALSATFFCQLTHFKSNAALLTAFVIG